MNAVSCFGSVYAVGGGLHNFDNFGILDTAGIVCAAHCTKHSEQMKLLCADRCINGGAGRVIEI